MMGLRDEQFVGRASELLTRTRLLLDSPAANDAEMRSLLEDLELVLAQIVRLQDAHASRTELDLINRALQQRDVMPRLRTAVADISANSRLLYAVRFLILRCVSIGARSG